MFSQSIGIDLISMILIKISPSAYCMLAIRGVQYDLFHRNKY